MLLILCCHYKGVLVDLVHVHTIFRPFTFNLGAFHFIRLYNYRDELYLHKANTKRAFYLLISRIK